MYLLSVTCSLIRLCSKLDFGVLSENVPFPSLLTKTCPFSLNTGWQHVTSPFRLTYAITELTTTTTALLFEQQEGGSSLSFVHLVCNEPVTCAGAMQHDPARPSSATSFLGWLFPGWAEGLWSTCTCVVQLNWSKLIPYCIIMVSDTETDTSTCTSVVQASWDGLRYLFF